MKTIFTKR